MQIPIIFALLTLISTKQQYAYTVRYSKSYSPSKVPQNVGCSQKNIVYGNFIYPQGPTDVLYFISNPHTYNVYLQCRNEKVFAKIFGTGQDYEVLLKTDANTLANRVRGSVNIDNYIVDWKYPPSKDYEGSRQWLISFVSALTNFNKTVYVKAPASYFCYHSGEERQSYLLTQKMGAKYIVEMYGEQPGQYTTYDQIFGDPDKISDNLQCSTHPSYAFLAKRYPHKDFYIEKTLLKEQAGYIGPKLQKFLKKAQTIYDKIIFMDSYSRQIIDL